MINFLGLSPNSANERLGKLYPQYCGLFTSPRNRKSIPDAASYGVNIWASDNDCFVEYKPKRIENYIKTVAEYAETCVFFTAPDVVGDANKTLRLYYEWYPKIKSAGLPVAFVLQNGYEKLFIPECDALFVGGSTEFKYSSQVMETCIRWKNMGKWIHVGRVNSISRMLAISSFADSFDGKSFQWTENFMRCIGYQSVVQSRLF